MEETWTRFFGHKKHNSQKQIPQTTASKQVFLGNKFRQTLKNNNFYLNSVNIKNKNRKKDEFKGNKGNKPFLITSKNLNPHKKKIKTPNKNKIKKLNDNNIIENNLIKSSHTSTEINFYPKTMKKKGSSFNINKLNSSSNLKYNIKTIKEDNIIQQQKEQHILRIGEETNKILESQQINEKKIEELEERERQLEKDKNKIYEEERKKAKRRRKRNNKRIRKKKNKGRRKDK